MTPVFSTCFEDISLSRVSGYHYHPTLTIHASSPLCDKDSYQIPMLFEMLVCSPLMSATFRLWWCLVDGAQGGTASVLCSWSSTNHRSGLSLSLTVAMVKVFVCVCAGWQGLEGWEMLDYTRPTVLLKNAPTLFPFKVDQFKSDIKIRNNQVKKNTAKGYSIYIQWSS